MEFGRTSRFIRDVRLAQRRGKDLDKLWAVVGRLAVGQPLEARHRQHRLSGNFSGSWECHVEPDWLLIWEQDDDAITLVRTGTHTDLFD
ncbi:MAG: type II toxin-antitoxin system YafQ family toxin [Dehalococcoidia bacterium]|nr:type II toxin-antitoxin system YafQ family toxin [Chloroflexota bacterium]MXW25598.1 type II toxin-antitoxin system YafQ family toxin [Dehalococcoidia bacterium]MXZ88079.1 type II toxin-antitoxin system YafQ family toxin [Dehalococcoidia bacterium]MYA54080.1 type II toxin-antitoxin system YafQ family toxin [Dehalococcoidia bacterium]MYI86965.1 type II toxin-antitoxin system YafQ family toxin [Dehalococcoidia bacterium]